MTKIRSTAGAATVAALLIAAGLASCSSSDSERSDPVSPSSVQPEPTTSRISTISEPARTEPTSTVSTDTANSTLPPTTDKQLPDSTPGPNPVGHVLLQLPADQDAPPLVVDVWYPSDATAGPPARYDLIESVGVTSSIAQSEVPVADGHYPLIVYSHGSGGYRFTATFFTEILASYGYVVAAVDHPGDTIIDGYIRGGGLAGAELREAVRARVGDLQRVIDAVVDGPTLVSNAVDGEKIVLAGHSLGGAGVIATAAADDRIDALIAMDPTWGMVDPSETVAVKIPMLTLWSSAGDPAESHLIESDYGGSWDRVDLDAATHAGFTDVCSYPPLLPEWLAAGAPEAIKTYVDGVVAETCNPSVMSPQRLHDLVVGYSIVYLDRILNDDIDADALLRKKQPDTEFTTGP